MTVQEAAQKVEVNLKDFAELGDELAEYVGTLKLERKTRDEISRLITEFESTLSKPVELDPKGLSKWLPGLESAVLLDGERLVLRKGGKELQVSVLKLEPDPYLAVVREAATAVAKLMEEEDARRAESIKPALQVSARLAGGKLAVFDWRSYVLVFTNLGGTARRVTISVSTAEGERYGPFDVDARETKEVELRHFRRILRSGVLNVRARCEDEEGKKYVGDVELRPNTKAVRVFKLVPVT